MTSTQEAIKYRDSGRLKIQDLKLMNQNNETSNDLSREKKIGQMPLYDMVIVFVYMVINPVTPL